MRYKRYINETTNITIPLAKSIIKNGMSEIFNTLKNFNWIIKDDEIIFLLNKIYRKNDIYFILSKTRKRSVGKFIHSAIVNDKSIMIIFVNKDIGNMFRKFSKPGKDVVFFDDEKNEFFRELLESISHELIHIKQGMKSKGKSFFQNIGSGDGLDIDYFSDPAEIEAFAQQAAVEYSKMGRSKILDYVKSLLISNKKEKLYKKFVKKFIYYLERI